MSARREAAVVGVILLVPLSLVPAATDAQTVEVGADVATELRLFPQAPLWPAQTDAHAVPSIALRPAVSIESADGRWWLAAEAFGRFDARDAERSHVDVRELGVGRLGDHLTAFVGVGQTFWGVTEIAHLVDVVNQVDAVEDLDGEEKLGQAMMALTWEGHWGALDVFYLPWARERSFHSADARLGRPIVVEEKSSYASSRGRWQPTLAARAFRTVGRLDLGLSAFRGTSREPRFVASGNVDGVPRFRAHYDLVTQFGIDAQWTGDATLLKLEAITRDGHAERLYAMSAGVEHTLYQRIGDGDLGLIGEMMLDSRDETAPPTLFDRDVFLGARWALNDVADTSVLGGPMVDLRSGETLLLVEARRRLATAWRVEMDLRLFRNTEPGSPAHPVRRDGFFGVTLVRYF